MNEYIERKAVFDKLEVIYDLAKTNQRAVITDALREVSHIPAADVQPVKHGKWDGYICSECNVCADYFISGDFYFDEKPNFCPYCGADMRGDT